jgi:hypothetical protein
MWMPTLFGLKIGQSYVESNKTDSNQKEWYA